MIPQSHRLVLAIIAIIIAVALVLFFYFERAEAPVAMIETTQTSTTTTQETAPTTDPVVTTPTEPSAPTPAPQPVAEKTTPAPTKPKTAPAPKQTTGYDAFIRYTNTGFEPFRVTILPGQTVRFYNDSDRDMWVAAAIHPTHTNYLERNPKDCLGSSFDQCEAVPKGQYWDFKFNPVGSWDFHNHMRGRDTGTVFVVEPE